MSKEKELTHEDVQKIVSSYMNEEHVALVEKAYHFAEVAHHDQRRKSGEPYIIHPIQVAGSLLIFIWIPKQFVQDIYMIL